MKNEKLEKLARNLDEKEAKEQEGAPAATPHENTGVEALPDELAEKLAGGSNRVCTNSGCSC